MTTLANRLRAAMDHAGLKPADLARACGVKPPSVSDWLRGKTLSMKAEPLRRAALALGVDRDWLGSGLGSPNWTNEQHSSARGKGKVAHPMSHLVESNSPLVTWGEKMEKHLLPQRFRVEVPDDSMSPRVRAGQLVEFERDTEPRPGDGVLVRDSEGNCYFRMYRERRPGHWEAYPLNEAYRPLDSREDQLEVVGVLVAVLARWA